MNNFFEKAQTLNFYCHINVITLTSFGFRTNFQFLWPHDNSTRFLHDLRTHVGNNQSKNVKKKSQQWPSEPK